MNIKINRITDNKKFWHTVKPLFSDKINHIETINMIDNGFTLSNDEVIVETLNKYFCSIAKSYHYQKIFLLRRGQLNSLLNLFYLYWKHLKIVQA